MTGYSGGGWTTDWVAALDTPAQFLPDDALGYRNLRSSTHAAMYYPWITVAHPADGSRLDVPPAAYVAGIWARSDHFRGVIKAPANEVVRSALDLETRLNRSQQELLNPEDSVLIVTIDARAADRVCDALRARGYHPAAQSVLL